MLVISGILFCKLALAARLSFNLAIEMLVISGRCPARMRIPPIPSFNLAIEMLVISGSDNTCCASSGDNVSISQSRCLSFQVARAYQATRTPNGSFNLAIEMLVISGGKCRARRDNRTYCFNLAIEMLVISGFSHVGGLEHELVCFNLAIEMLVISGCSNLPRPIACPNCFNLAIEMLVISGYSVQRLFHNRCIVVSISQSRCLSFQAYPSLPRRLALPCFNLAIEMLVISGQHRLSFVGYPHPEFQSRNRDACHFRLFGVQRGCPVSHRFNLAIEMLVISGRHAESHRSLCLKVSISQSRCLSFQVNCPVLAKPFARHSFNLAIEMLVISGPCPQSP